MEVGGTTVKDILEDPDTGQLYIAKLGKRNNDLEVMTEYAIYVVGRTLGVPVAAARIATFRGKLRFLSSYFLDRTTPEELVHGVQLFNQLYDETTVKEVLRDESKEQAMFNVQAIKTAFGAHYLQYGERVEDELFTAFVSMLTHDALIGVQDRHHENWGVVVHREVGGAVPRFAPLYDSARGLFCNENDDALAQRYSGQAGVQRLEHYVARARPLIGFQGLGPTDNRKYITYDQLIAAIYQRYPEQRRTIDLILETFDWRQVHADLITELGSHWSGHRIDLIRICLHRRYQALIRAIHGSSISEGILNV